MLVARDEFKLAAVVEDLEARGAKVQAINADLADIATHEALLQEAFSEPVDVVLLAYGILGNQVKLEKDIEALQELFQVNLVSAVALLTKIANYMQKQTAGTIAVISSAAGDRGRQSNYVYGASKAGLSIFAQGLRNRLFKSGVHVVTIKPGLIDTPMTASMVKGPLYVKPRTIAAGIVRAIDKRRNTVRLPWFWYGIMTIIKSIPETIFKRLSL